jgi:hypothetical protein
LFSGQAEVYVLASGGGQGKWQVSPNGGQVPQWSQDGKELYYYYFDSTQSLDRDGGDGSTASPGGSRPSHRQDRPEERCP